MNATTSSTNLLLSGDIPISVVLHQREIGKTTVNKEKLSDANRPKYFFYKNNEPSETVTIMLSHATSLTIAKERCEPWVDEEVSGWGNSVGSIKGFIPNQSKADELLKKLQPVGNLVFLTPQGKIRYRKYLESFDKLLNSPLYRYVSNFKNIPCEDHSETADLQQENIHCLKKALDVLEKLELDDVVQGDEHTRKLVYSIHSRMKVIVPTDIFDEPMLPLAYKLEQLMEPIRKRNNENKKKKEDRVGWKLWPNYQLWREAKITYKGKDRVVIGNDKLLKYSPDKNNPSRPLSTEEACLAHLHIHFGMYINSLNGSRGSFITQGDIHAVDRIFDGYIRRVYPEEYNDNIFKSREYPNSQKQKYLSSTPKVLEKVNKINNIKRNIVS